MSDTSPEQESSQERGANTAPSKTIAGVRQAQNSSKSGSENSENSDKNETSESNPRRPRRRGSRGGRGRSTAARVGARQQNQTPVEAQAETQAQAQAQSDQPKPDAEVSVQQKDETSTAKPRRSPSRVGKSIEKENRAVAKESRPEYGIHAASSPTVSPKPKIGDEPIIESEPKEVAMPDGLEEAEAQKKKRKRSGRKKTTVKRTDTLGEYPSNEVFLDEETLERRRGRERKGRPVGRYLMCVQKRSRATQIAVLEGRSLIEHYVSKPNDDVSQIDGNIYLSRVQNVLPGMEAAFIDIGTPKNAVLYRGDVRYDADDLLESTPHEDVRIEQMIKPGQVLICQVTKNPIGSKGARLTQEVSLPGHFVVLIPNSKTYGISKRLDDNERKRLRRVLDEVKPAHHGIIVRTAAEGVTAEELRRDVARLLRQWEQIEQLGESASAPSLLYREPDIAVRIIREEFNKNYRGVIIDDKNLYEEVREYVSSISPELADRIEYYDKRSEPLPLFERYHVHEQLHKALDRKVWLPSGGSLIIERTEALTVIDVNTGKNVGKSNLEETVFRNNLEAAEEIAHQLRLRDIGGIIVIDFIDMEIRANRDAVLNRLREALARDKTRTQAYPIGELGLVEMTRKRVSEGLVESFSDLCPSCSGRGFVIDEALLSD